MRLDGARFSMFVVQLLVVRRSQLLIHFLQYHSLDHRIVYQHVFLVRDGILHALCRSDWIHLEGLFLGAVDRYMYEGLV